MTFIHQFTHSFQHTFGSKFKITGTGFNGNKIAAEIASKMQESDQANYHDYKAESVKEGKDHFIYTGTYEGRDAGYRGDESTIVNTICAEQNITLSDELLGINDNYAWGSESDPI